MERLIKAGFNNVKTGVAKNYYTRTFTLFVILPTLIAAIYYLFIASDVYVSQSKYSVNVESQNVGGGSALGGLLPSIGLTANNIEAGVAEAYIASYTILDKLVKEAKIKEVFSNPKADFFARLKQGANQEELYDYYTGAVKTEFDLNTGVTTLKVHAFSAEEARDLNQKILDSTEDFINKMSDRMQEDSLQFAEKQLKESEDLIAENNREISDFRNKNKNFDPVISAKNVVGIGAKLEQELAKTQAELADLRNYAKENNPRLEALKMKVSAMQSQINSETGKLAGDDTPPLAWLTQQYEALLMQKEFAAKRYEIAIKTYELEKVNSAKKKKYLLRIEEPTMLDIASEPERFMGILKVFICALISYTFGGLIIAGIKDHIRP